MGNGLAPNEDDADAVVEVSVEGDENTVLLGVVDGLCAVSSADPLEMEPLHTYVDVDLLDGVVESMSAGRTDANVSLTFAVEEYEVTVQCDGHIRVAAHAPRAESATD